MDITFVDLFCGMGSFHYSFKKLGFKCIMASDIYKPAKENYKTNYDLDVLDDICNIEPSTLPYYDILCAGFPCQPFSQAGYHKGFTDTRGTMFFQVMRFVKQNSLKLLFLKMFKLFLVTMKVKVFQKLNKI